MAEASEVREAKKNLDDLQVRIVRAFKEQPVKYREYEASPPHGLPRYDERQLRIPGFHDAWRQRVARWGYGRDLDSFVSAFVDAVEEAGRQQQEFLNQSGMELDRLRNAEERARLQESLKKAAAALAPAEPAEAAPMSASALAPAAGAEADDEAEDEEEWVEEEGDDS